MNAREELAAVIIEHPWLASYQELYTGICPSCPGLKIHGGGNSPAHADHLADAILAAGYRKPRTITTAEELDALPFYAVIIDAYDTPHICERHRTDGTRNEWRMAGHNHLIDSEEVLWHGPATVAHEPSKP